MAQHASASLFLSIVQLLDKVSGFPKLMESGVKYELWCKQGRCHPFCLSPIEAPLPLVYRRHVQMNCRIDTSRESDDAAPENIGSSPGASTRDSWRCDLCVEGCEVSYCYGDVVNSLESIGCRNWNGEIQKDKTHYEAIHLDGAKKMK